MFGTVTLLSGAGTSETPVAASHAHYVTEWLNLRRWSSPHCRAALPMSGPDKFAGGTEARSR
jgi:hypothetical protein